MRSRRTVVPASAIAFALLAPAGLGEHRPSACLGAAPRAAIHLPAPVTIAAGSTGAGYRMGCDGRLSRIRLPSLWPFGSGTGCCVPPDVWWTIRRGHLVVVRWSRVLWGSRGKFQERFGLGAVEIGRRTIAFSYGSNLFLAPVNGAERLIGRDEYALGFTRGGLYTISWIHGLLLRSDEGAIRKRIVHWPTDYVAAGGRLYFIADGTLMTARGARIQRLASLASLGFSPDTGLQQVGSLLELQDNDRLMLLRGDGSVFASTPIPPQAAAIVGLAVAPSAHSVAFVTPAQSSRTETVYVLRAGAHDAVPVLTERHVMFPVCAGGGATLQWRGGWILYSSSEDRLAAIDTSGPHRVIELSRLVAGLPGTGQGITANWAG